MIVSADRRNADLVIDLGCGKTKVEGAVGVDNVALPGVDIVHDLLDIPYPFEDGSAQMVYLHHVLEHFSIEDTRNILNEVHRILKPDGVLEVHVPHVFSVAAWTDPTHRQTFTFGSAKFFDAHGTKAYYKETSSCWELIHTSCDVTCFNWKRYRLRQIDATLGRLLRRLCNRLLELETWPGSADLLVKALPLFFVEIQWQLRR